MKKIIALSVLIATSFTNCSDDDNIDTDPAPPVITIESPSFSPVQVYSTNSGNELEPEIAVLAAEAVDETEIRLIRLSVSDNSGNTVFEQTEEVNLENETTLSISAEFSTTEADAYSVIYTAIDVSGNLRVSNPRPFIYTD